MLKVACDGCGKTINAPPKYAGRRVACPSCGTEIEIPASQSPPPIPTHAGGSPDAFESIVEDAVPATPAVPMTPYEEPIRDRMESGPYKAADERPPLKPLAKRYFALRIIASIHRVFGAVMLIASLVIVIMSLPRGEPPLAALVPLVVSLPLFATGESILLFIDVEENTRRTSEATVAMLKRQSRDESAY